MRILRKFTEIYDSGEIYLLLLGSICGVLIVAFQCCRTEFQLDFIRIVPLLLIGLSLFFSLKRKCVPAGFRLAFIGVMYIILAYLAWPTRLDWVEWHDQAHYLRMVNELSHGYLTSDSFRYGLGYPILSVPFYFLMGKDALFIPNLAAFAGTLYFSYLLFCSLTNELKAKVSLLFIIFATTLPYHHVIWWSHGIAIFCLVFLFYLALNPLTDTRLLLAGLVIGYAFFTRYIEIMIFLPIILYILWRTKLRGLALMTVGVMPFIAVTFTAQRLVFGDWFMTPYEIRFGLPTKIFWLERIPRNFFLTFLYFPKDLAMDINGMLKVTVLISAFYVIFAPMGAYLLYRSSKDKKGLTIAMITSVISCILYATSYYQFDSGTFGQFPADFRYLLLSYPYVVFFSIIGLLTFIKTSTESKSQVQKNRAYE